MQGDVGVDVDGGDPFAADELGDKGGVVPDSGTDLEDLVAGMRAELVEHHRDDGGRRRAGQRERLAGVVLDGHGRVCQTSGVSEEVGATDGLSTGGRRR